MFGLLTQSTLRRARFAPMQDAVQGLERAGKATLTPRKAILAINLFYSLCDQAAADVCIPAAENLLEDFHGSPLTPETVDYLHLFLVRALQKFAPYESKALLVGDLPIYREKVHPLIYRICQLRDQGGERVL